jgi:hypothetical protein
MANKHVITFEYVVTLPDRGTPEFNKLVDAFLKEDPTYEMSDPESMQPQVLEGALTYWLAQEYQGGNYTDIVEFIDYDIERYPEA